MRHAHERRLGLPSWVRNLLEINQRDFYLSVFHCSGNSKANLKVGSNQLALVLQGFGIAAVRIVLGRKHTDKLRSTERGNPSYAWTSSSKAVKSCHYDKQEHWKLNGDVEYNDDAGLLHGPMPIQWFALHRLHDLLFGKGHHSATSVEDVSEAGFSFRSFAGAVCAPQKDNALPTMAKDWKQWDSSFKMPTNGFIKWRYLLETRKLADGHHNKDVVLSALHRTDFVSEMDFFFSLDGRIGLCQKGTHSGDVIVGLFGGDVSFVLRPKKTNPSIPISEHLRQGPKYEMIGPCYIDGAMQGEQMGHHSWINTLHADPLETGPHLYPNSGDYCIGGVYPTRFYYIE